MVMTHEHWETELQRGFAAVHQRGLPPNAGWSVAWRADAIRRSRSTSDASMSSRKLWPHGWT